MGVVSKCCIYVFACLWQQVRRDHGGWRHVCYALLKRMLKPSHIYSKNNQKCPFHSFSPDFFIHLGSEISTDPSTHPTSPPPAPQPPFPPARATPSRAQAPGLHTRHAGSGTRLPRPPIPFPLPSPPRQHRQTPSWRKTLVRATPALQRLRV